MYQEGTLQVSECLHPYLASGITAQPGNTCKRGIQGKAHRESVTSLLPQPRVKRLVKIKHSWGGGRGQGGRKRIILVPGHRLGIYCQVQKQAGS